MYRSWSSPHSNAMLLSEPNQPRTKFPSSKLIRVLHLQPSPTKLQGPFPRSTSRDGSSCEHVSASPPSASIQAARAPPNTRTQAVSSCGQSVAMASNDFVIPAGMENFVVGLIGMGDMGKMYAERLSAAGWR